MVARRRVTVGEKDNEPMSAWSGLGGVHTGTTDRSTAGPVPPAAPVGSSTIDRSHGPTHPAPPGWTPQGRRGTWIDPRFGGHLLFDDRSGEYAWRDRQSGEWKTSTTRPQDGEITPDT